MGNGISLMLFGVIVIFGVVFWFMTKNDRSSNSNSKENGKDKNSKKSNTDANIADIKKEDVFKFMEFDRILDDMIVQNNGQKFTMAVKCKGINYDLMSEVEQLAVEEGFITFLNTLKFPIQLYVQAQNMDLKSAINMYKENISSVKDEFEERNLEYTRITEAFDSTQDEIDEAAQKREEVLNVYEYANDIISYVEKMSMNKNLLQRSFYVLVSYYTSEINAAEKFSKDEINNLCYSELYTRAQSIISALASCSVEGRVLNSNELADLLYTAYNRDDKGLMNVKDAIESGFYRLYSTSNDAFSRREELLQKQIEEDARLKAYQTIVNTINDGTYKSAKMDALKIEEDTSRLANDIIRRENIPENIKETAQKKVVDEYREVKKQVIQEVNQEKKVLYEQASKIEGIKNIDQSKLQPKIENKVNPNINNSQVQQISSVTNTSNSSISNNINPNISNNNSINANGSENVNRSNNINNTVTNVNEEKIENKSKSFSSENDSIV